MLQIYLMRPSSEDAYHAEFHHYAAFMQSGIAMTSKVKFGKKQEIPFGGKPLSFNLNESGMIACVHFTVWLLFSKPCLIILTSPSNTHKIC